MIGRSVAAVLGLAAVAGHGFNKGLNSSGASGAFFNAISGNPNLDQDILGTRLSAVDLFMPPPSPFPSRLQVAAHGLPGARSGIPRLLATMRTGFLNKKMITAGISRAGDPFASNSNAAPYADGSMVFGLYNSRYGR